MHQLIRTQQLNTVKIVFADEAVFTFNTFVTKAWQKSYCSVSIPESAIRVKTHAFVAGISEEVGFECCLIKLRSIDTASFIEFLRKLSHDNLQKPIALFIDNLQVHKSEEVMKVYGELNMTPIFNIPYSPQFNGIESYFSLVKAEYKKNLLQYLIKNQSF
jgi:transposase